VDRSSLHELNAKEEIPVCGQTITNLAQEYLALGHNVNRGAPYQLSPHANFKAVAGDLDDARNGGRTDGGHGIQALQTGRNIDGNPRFAAALNAESGGGG
jgi:hypothetical protein